MEPITAIANPYPTSLIDNTTGGPSRRADAVSGGSKGRTGEGVISNETINQPRNSVAGFGSPTSTGPVAGAEFHSLLDDPEFVASLRRVASVLTEGHGYGSAWTDDVLQVMLEEVCRMERAGKLDGAHTPDVLARYCARRAGQKRLQRKFAPVVHDQLIPECAGDDAAPLSRELIVRTDPVLACDGGVAGDQDNTVSRESIARWIKLGYTLRWIALRTGLTKNQVATVRRYIAKGMMVPKRMRAGTRTQAERYRCHESNASPMQCKMIELLSTHTMREIAQTLGISRSQVVWALRKLKQGKQWNLACVCLLAIGLCAQSQTSTKPHVEMAKTTVLPDLTPKICPKCKRARTVVVTDVNRIHCTNCNLRLHIGHCTWKEQLPGGVRVSKSVAYGVVTSCTNLTPELVRIRVNGKRYDVSAGDLRIRDSVGKVVYIWRHTYTNKVSWSCGMEEK